MSTHAASRTLFKGAGAKTVLFVIRYDDEGIVDTISRNGVPLSSTHREARSILRKADAILAHTSAPPGFRFNR